MEKMMTLEGAKNTAKERLFLSVKLRLPDLFPPFPRLFALLTLANVDKQHRQSDAQTERFHT